jgi:hypothetical protein
VTPRVCFGGPLGPVSLHPDDEATDATQLAKLFVLLRLPVRGVRSGDLYSGLFILIEPVSALVLEICRMGICRPAWFIGINASIYIGVFTGVGALVYFLISYVPWRNVRVIALGLVLLLPVLSSLRVLLRIPAGAVVAGRILSGKQCTVTSRSADEWCTGFLPSHLDASASKSETGMATLRESQTLSPSCVALLCVAIGVVLLPVRSALPAPSERPVKNSRSRNDANCRSCPPGANI